MGTVKDIVRPDRRHLEHGVRRHRLRLRVGRVQRPEHPERVERRPQRELHARRPGRPRVLDLERRLPRAHRVHGLAGAPRAARRKAPAPRRLPRGGDPRAQRRVDPHRAGRVPRAQRRRDRGAARDADVDLPGADGDAAPERGRGRSARRHDGPLPRVGERRVDREHPPRSSRRPASSRAPQGATRGRWRFSRSPASSARCSRSATAGGSRPPPRSRGASRGSPSDASRASCCRRPPPSPRSWRPPRSPS